MAHISFCSSAIECFRKEQRRPDLSLQDKRILGWLCDTLALAQKFLLPDGGQLMADIDIVKNADLMRLPFPVTALEYNLRRGHIRRLEDRVVWVNSTIVGSQGFADKAYRVRGEVKNAQ